MSRSFVGRFGMSRFDMSRFDMGFVSFRFSRFRALCGRGISLVSPTPNKRARMSDRKRQERSHEVRTLRERFAPWPMSEEGKC